MALRILYTLILCSFFSFVFPQRTDLINKIRKRLEANKNLEDTNRVSDMIRLSKLLFKLDYAEAVKYNTEGMRLAKKLNRVDLQISANNAMGDGFWFVAQYDKAFDFYYKAYKLADSVNDKSQTAFSLYNLGWLSCINQKNYKDISYLYRSLQLSLELKDIFGIIRVHNALGDCYSIKYQNERVKSDFDSAVHYLKGGLDMARKAKHYAHLNTFYVNLGDLFYSIEDYASSKFYHESALDSYRLKGDSADLVYVYYKIALCDYGLGETKNTVKVIERSYRLFKAKGQRDAELEALQSLAKAYYDAKDFKLAYEYFDNYAKLKEEIDKTTYATSLIGMENSRSLEKAEANVIQLQQSNEIQELKNKRKTVYISVLIGIGLVIVVIAYLLFRQGKLRQATNLKLKEQNKIISEKKLEIEQSIEYAKGIQTAFLPSKDELNLLIKENFIFYKPKDVVSGDFYWYLINEHQNGLLLACADCTGHGVPGALMSMVGINILQQLSVERKIQSPGLILKYLNAEIKNSLKQNSDQSTQRDGMDVAMIYVDLVSKKLTYAGANRPLYIVRDNEVIEYKATKHAIGGFTKYDQTFDEVKIDLQKNDLICLSTDGYADQFGGPEAKKFMTKNLKALLVKTAHLGAAEQMAELETVFNNWKGNHMQIDDVLIMGLRL